MSTGGRVFIVLPEHVKRGQVSALGCRLAPEDVACGSCDATSRVSEATPGGASQHAACTAGQSNAQAMQPSVGRFQSVSTRGRRRSDLGFLFCSAEARLTGRGGRGGRGGEGQRPGYRTLLSSTPLLKARVQSEALPPAGGAVFLTSQTCACGGGRGSRPALPPPARGSSARRAWASSGPPSAPPAAPPP